MKIALDCGHGVRCANGKHDIGARGNGKQEDDLVLELGNLIESKLMKLGHKIVKVRPLSAISVSDSLQKRCHKANVSKCDIFVSLHFNALNGRVGGSEVFAASKAGSAIASSVLDEIVELGFYDRGVKPANFWVIRNTTMPAILIECCFIDNAKDMALYNANKMADAIVSGLVADANRYDDEINTEVDLTVISQTFLKRNTKQSDSLKDEDKKVIHPCTVRCILVGKDEGHYLIRIDGQNWFIYSEHCKIKQS